MNKSDEKETLKDIRRLGFSKKQAFKIYNLMQTLGVIAWRAGYDQAKADIIKLRQTVLDRTEHVSGMKSNDEYPNNLRATNDKRN